MSRRALWLTALAAATGLGIYFLSRQARTEPTSHEIGEEFPLEKMRDDLGMQLEETSRRIKETREAIEEAFRRSQETAGSAVESLSETTKKAALAAAITAVWTGLLAAIVIYIYAPERYQQERLWHTTKAVLAPMGTALTALWRLGGRARQTGTY